ncbi:MAG: hypothetical protein L0099_07360 [Acidobacteria bacterium]|nr:hypothetical protein [Acidobacteriota bacterium]
MYEVMESHAHHDPVVAFMLTVHGEYCAVLTPQQTRDFLSLFSESMRSAMCITIHRE